MAAPARPARTGPGSKRPRGAPRKRSPPTAPLRRARKAVRSRVPPARPSGLVPWDLFVAVLCHPSAQGSGVIHVVSRREFWDEADLPFTFHGGGSVCRIVPRPGFRKESMAASEDERALIVDCPDDEGWLVPEGIVGQWMARHVRVPALDDLLLSHRVYEYLTSPDDDGLSRGGEAELVQWTPGVPTVASIAAPEFLPTDPDAPRVNRSRAAYAAAVRDLVRQMERRFALSEVEVGVRFGRDPPPYDDGPLA